MPSENGCQDRSERRPKVFLAAAPYVNPGCPVNQRFHKSHMSSAFHRLDVTPALLSIFLENNAGSGSLKDYYTIAAAALGVDLDLICLVGRIGM